MKLFVNHLDIKSFEAKLEPLKHIDVITLENNEYDNKFQLYLKDKGYDFICRLGCDELYKKQ